MSDARPTPHSPAETAAAGSGRRALEEMDPQLGWTQPGSGVVVHLELAWGRIRRAWLKTFRRGYVKKMEASRRGDANAAPCEVLDPRDLKYYRNQPGYWWKPEDDPFRWRDNIPFARWGLAELFVFSLLFFGGAGLACWLVAALGLGSLGQTIGHTTAAILTVLGILIVWFFRDPPRTVPADPGLVVSPADGKVVEITEVEDDFVGPAIQIGIFLSIFNVHINRMPAAGRVIGLRYRPGKYLNALRPESARENEQLAVRMEQNEPPHRPMIVRQITGAIARRIVNDLKPGDELPAGAKFGMIKLGSRTELLLPREPGLEVLVRPGDRVKAGSSIVARYGEAP